MSKYCANCGNGIPAEARFCNKCGASVARSESAQAATGGSASADMSPLPQASSPNLLPPPQPEPPPINVPPPPPQTGRGSRKGVILGVGCATLLGLGLLLVAGLVLLSMCGGGGGGGAGLQPPTEQEVQQAIERGFTETYSNQAGGPATFEDVQVSFEFGPMEVGELVDHQMDLGEDPVPSYPVNVPVEVTTTYTFEDGTTSSETAFRGDHPENPSAGSDVFWFYVDEFGEWNFRTGSA